ncbi:hypothetical protein BDE02_16G101600 [Populus trichocarpa]|nr:hypothetical protein BDE02_16G101600 [Populus trichocarpa]
MELVLFNNCCGFLRQIIDSCSFADRTGPDLMFVFKFCTHCGGCMSTGLGLILSQEYAYLGRESLHRIHWVLVHTMNNDAFMRCNAFQSAHCPPIRSQFHWLACKRACISISG